MPTSPAANGTAGPAVLRSELRLGGAVLLGLGSILGTGVFVSLGYAAAGAGPRIVAAIGVAAFVALLNGLSSAQLAAVHPVSGGTYEYAYRRLSPSLGITAGWMFLCAKSASAATAALGFAGYLSVTLGFDEPRARIPLAIAAVLMITLLAWSGLHWSARINGILVFVTILSLLAFVAVVGLSGHGGRDRGLTGPTAVIAAGSDVGPFLEACALMFVAFTGYGRIATLGEEVHHPERTIPLAILITLGLAMMLYMAVAWAVIQAVDPASLREFVQRQPAPLETISQRYSRGWLPRMVAAGALTAMLGVLLNLVLGLSRVALAMGRRRDLPEAFARVDAHGRAPTVAVIGVGFVIGLLVLTGDVKTTWSFSAFTVLVYYAITNLAALQLKAIERRFPPLVPILGLLSCLSLAFWVDRPVWIFGLTLIALVLFWQQCVVLWPRYHQFRRGR